MSAAPDSPEHVGARPPLEVSEIVLVNQLLARYGHAVDAAKHQPVDAEPQRQLTEIFTEDAVFDLSAVNGLRCSGLGQIRRMFSAPPPQHPPSHHSTNVYVYLDGARVRARSKWFVTDPAGRLMQGEYHDTLAFGDGGWRIAERVVSQLAPPPPVAR